MPQWTTIRQEIAANSSQVTVIEYNADKKVPPKGRDGTRGIAIVEIDYFFADWRFSATFTDESCAAGETGKT
ncbi:hypothetical protein SAMN02745781_03436 [Vibrio gazogenes DSM 21264]|uniref:Uncharacterized protein n=1 Tax=Vibrio gazogenes DSM 21264 = NBRC 103151 TaxID=1123492 RepID=A0A1M5FBQ9_VIBGA|nr:hypothetical protein SAMN02745781_03436 [Vibrio gazogenes DSM 21264] [Vibrio gazogenes DSM 21264 = NBRC 103151]SJN54580.1 hypothetical protein BQ6471_01099 [Vibrio gazogenes]